MSTYPPSEYDPQHPADPPTAISSVSAANQPVTYPPYDPAYSSSLQAPNYPPPPGYPQAPSYPPPPLYPGVPPSAYGQPGTMGPLPPPPGYPPSAPYPPYAQPGAYPPPPNQGYPAGYPGMPMYAPMMIGVPMYAPDPGAGQATTSMVLGIIGLSLSIFSLSPYCAVINLTLGVVGIVMGILGRRSATRRGQAIAGLVMSIITLAIALGIGGLFFVLSLHRGY